MTINPLFVKRPKGRRKAPTGEGARRLKEPPRIVSIFLHGGKCDPLPIVFNRRHE